MKIKHTNNSAKQIKTLISGVACFILFCLFFADIKAEAADYSDEIKVIIGETQTLSVSNPKQVKIGNPNLLDVASAGEKELLLSGLAEGETQLTVVDNYGQHIYAVKIFKEDLDKIKERVDVLLKAAGFDRLATQIGDKERKIFILGEVPASQKDSLESKLELVKDKIVNLVEYKDDIPTVEIDVEVLEIAKTDLDNLGFTWNTSIAFNEPNTSGFPSGLLNPARTLHILKSWRADELAATLNLLKQDNRARTLSRPKLVCLSGKEAKLLVGGERPIITSSTTTSGTGGVSTGYNIEMKEYGISLNVKPVVKENDEISVNLEVKITDIDTSNAITLNSGVSTPGLTERSVQTELSLLSGQTVFLAGLIKSARADNRTQVPFLARIPLMGLFFRSKDLSQEDTEIVITLSPTILRNKSLNEIPASSEAVVKVPALTQNLSKRQDVEPIEARPIADDDPVFVYSTLIQNIINSNINYPQELKNKGIGGTVKLSLHLLPDGKLLGVVIMQSSGNQSLDDTAEHNVKKLSPFPAFPSQLKLKELWIDIPLVFKADN
ncbi:MAG: TonB family protein [Candidatus Omnitrophica bacterium]|nr:TonB family protein [Candidatus Omnitrophota bacterium]MDD5351570.1 TonB family protein [Candidatus Omnitrophota bacterium]MDD5551005.1 TonB family protein [Candidatus Omnitrophota bacterium]